MDTYFVKDIEVITLCFHPEKSHVYYLTEPDSVNKQYIIEEDLLTFNIINKFEVCDETARLSDPYGYNLCFYKKKQYLLLTYPSSLITIWDTNSKALILKTYPLKKMAERITALALSESYPLMVFSVKNQIRLFVSNINDAISAESAVNFRRLKLSKKLTVNDIKCHPVEAKCAVACSDGLIRTWDLTGLNPMTPIVEATSGITAKKIDFLKAADFQKLNLPSVTCISFSADGTKLLSCNQQGKILCWDVTNLGEDATLIASIRVSERGVLSVSWFSYNGDYRSNRLLCYTQEGNVKSLEIEKTSDKRPDKKGVAWSIKELESIYQTKGGVNPEKIDIEPSYANFLKTHAVSNLVAVNTLKDKKVRTGKGIQLKFSLNSKCLIIYDKLDYLLDYPKISPNIHPPLNKIMFQPGQRTLNLAKEFFYIEDATLNKLNLVNGKKDVIIEFLRTPQLSDVVRTTKFEVRPITAEYVPQYSFLINFQKEQYNALLIAQYNLDNDPPFKLYKEIPCSLSLYIGDTSLHNPPVFILGEDRMSYMLFVDEPSKLDEETRKNVSADSGVRDSLNVKVKKVFWTPIRNGYVVLYLTAYDNLLRFSMNRLPTNNLLDFRALTTDYVFKAQYDDDIFDVTWQAKSGFVQNEQYLGAVMSWNKITIINENLQSAVSIKIPYYNIKTNMLINAFWYGYTLFYYTKNHLFYSTADGRSNCLFSFDNYLNKNLILNVMNDRVVVGSKLNILNSKHARQPKYKMEIRFRPLVLTEPILLGYLSLNKIYPDFVPDYNLVKHNFLLLETPNLSSELIKAFNEHKLFNASWFILGNQSFIQFTLEEKIKVLNKLVQFDKFFEVLFPGKYITDEADVNELVSNIINSPVYYLEKKLLKNQAEVFLNFGEFTKAVQCYDLTQEYKKISMLLNTLNEEQASQTFATKFLRDNKNKIFNYNIQAALMIQAGMVNDLVSFRNQAKSGTYIQKTEYKITNLKSYGTTIDFSLSDVRLVDSLYQIGSQELTPEQHQLYEQVRQTIRMEQDPMGDIQKLRIPFGENPYTFTYSIRPSADEDEKKACKFGEVSSATTHQYLGYNSLEGDSDKRKNEDGDFMGAAEGMDAEGDDESGAILVYWRFDEGKGSTVENLLGNNLSGAIEKNGAAPPQDNFWIPLEDGDPIEQEDKWGKKCPPQFSVRFEPDSTSVKCAKKSWYSSNVAKFSFELWLKPKSENGVIVEIGQGNFTFGFTNLELTLQVKGSVIPLNAESHEVANKYEGEEEEQGGADEDANKVKNNYWNHIAVVYDNSQPKKLQFYLNCLLVSSSEFTLPVDLFRDQILALGKEKLNAELTEFRFWGSALSLSDIKEQHRMPLEIVYEKKKEIKVKFKTLNKAVAPGGGLLKPQGLIPAPGAGLGLRPPPGSGFPAPEGNTFNTSVKSSFPTPDGGSFNAPGKSSFPAPDGGSFNAPVKSSFPAPEGVSFATVNKSSFPAPGDVTSFSNFAGDRSPEKRTSFGSSPGSKGLPKPDEHRNESPTSGGKYGRESEDNRANDFNTFSNFETKNKTSFQGFDQGDQSPEERKREEPTSFEKFSPQPGFDTFSNFNTAPAQTQAAGGFEGFGTWDNNSHENPVVADQKADFNNFGTFNQSPGQNEQKSNFNEFGDFNSFDKGPTKPTGAGDNFANFGSFNTRSTAEETKEVNQSSSSKVSTSAPKGHSMTSLRSSDEKKRRNHEEGTDSSVLSIENQNNFDISYTAGVPESHEFSFVQAMSLNDLNDDYKKQLAKAKRADEKQLIYVESLYKDLISLEVLNQSDIIKAQDVWINILNHLQKGEIAAAVEAIDDGIQLLRQQCLICSKSPDKTALKKVQKLIILMGRYRLGAQLLVGIKDQKSKENPSLRKTCFLYIVLYSLKLSFSTNPLYAIETAEINMKAKNYKIANQVYHDLINSENFDLTPEQREKVGERLRTIEDLPKENQTLVKVICPQCAHHFGFIGEYACPKCLKEFVLCFQTLACIDEESNLKCNACHACFSKAAKKVNERCTLCRTGVLCAKR